MSPGKNVLAWRARNAEKAAKDGRTDWGALEPCGWCEQAHPPGQCAHPGEHDDEPAASATSTPEGDPR